MIPGIVSSQPLALTDENGAVSSISVTGIGTLETVGTKAAFGAVSVEGIGDISFTFAHRYWRLYLPTNNGAAFTTAGEIEMREVVGGATVTTGGTAFASSQSATNTDPALAFDGIKAPSPSGPDSYWSTAQNNHSPSFIGYDFGEGNEKSINEISYYASRAVERQPSNIVVQSSDDGSDWKTEWAIGIETGWTLGEEREYPRTALPPVYVSDAKYLATGTTVTDEFDIDDVEFGPDRPDRLVIVAFGVGRGFTSFTAFSINSVQIGDTSATRAVRFLDGDGTTVTEIWYARPTGTTGKLKISASEVRMGRLAMSVFNAVVSGSDDTPFDTARKPPSDTSNTDIDVPANGFCIAAVHQRENVFNPPPPSLSGIEATYPIAGQETLLAARFGIETTQSAKTLTLVKGASALVAASWEF